MKGGWFLGPQSNGKESIFAFALYRAGQGGPSRHHVGPDRGGRQFAGVAGADFNLAFIQTLAEKVNASIYDGKGAVSIVTNDGLVVAASGKASAIGGRFDAVDDSAQQDANILREGRSQISVDSAHDLPESVRAGDAGPHRHSLVGDHHRAALVVMAEARKLAGDLAGRGRSDVTMQIIATLVVGAFAVVAMAFMANGISSPIANLAEALRRLARGESLAEIGGAHRKDEIGDISRAVDQIRVGAEAEALRKTQAAEADRQRADRERRDTMQRLADDFERAMGDVVKG